MKRTMSIIRRPGGYDSNRDIESKHRRTFRKVEKKSLKNDEQENKYKVDETFELPLANYVTLLNTSILYL